MEEQIKQTNPTLHKYLFTVTTFSKLLAMFLFILLPFVGFYLGMKYQEKTGNNSASNISLTSTTSKNYKFSPTPTLQPLIPTPLPRGKIVYYKNSAGFQVAYMDPAPNTYNAWNSCKNKQATKRKVFEDSNKIFISWEMTPVVTNGTKCNLEETTLNLLENGWDDSVSKLYADATYYMYKIINNDNDISELIKESFGQNCKYTFTKQPLGNGVYSITLEQDANQSIGCMLNYNYDFYYSSKDKVAVVGNKIQNCWPEGGEMNGVDGYGECRAKIIFP